MPTDGGQRLRMVRRPVSSGRAGAPRRHAGRTAPVATARVGGRRLAYGRVAAASLGAMVVHARLARQRCWIPNRLRLRRFLGSARMRKIPTFFWEYRGHDIPDPDLATYRLCVDGAVERRLALSLEELDGKLRRIEIDRRFYCVNGWSLKAVWAGYRVADLLGLAGSKSGAAYLRATSLGGYEDTSAIADPAPDEAMPVTHITGAPLARARS